MNIESDEWRYGALNIKEWPLLCGLFSFKHQHITFARCSSIPVFA